MIAFRARARTLAGCSQRRPRVRVFPLAAAALAGLLLAGAGTATERPGNAASRPSPRAQVSSGRLAGIRQGRVSAFLGVPYAAPPVGANRRRF